jgi:ring-1,2-phenylacetyl-CoA epoxidase subunit PaaE
MKTLSLTIKGVRKLTPDAIEITFEQPGEGALSYQAGQFLTFILNIEGKEYQRSYSICSSPYTGELPKVGIKRVKGGIVSNYLNDHAQEGMVVVSQQPSGRFTPTITPPHAEHYVLWAGGSGITPMMSIIKSVLQANPEGKVSLFYANRDEASIMFYEDLKELQKEHAGRLHITHILEQAPEGWQGLTGLLSPERVQELLRPLLQAGEPISHWMCGPSGMMEQIQKGYDALQLGKELHKEVFTSSTDKSKTDATAGNTQPEISRVIVHFDRETYEFEVPKGRTILDVALDKGIDLPHSCQSGICTTCMGKLKKGKVELEVKDALTEQEIEEGYVLTCVGHPLTEEVEIEID